MTASDLAARVTLTTAVALLPLAVAGGWLGGVAGAVGVMAGGALAVGSFRALVARTTATTRGTSVVPWPLAAAVRFGAVVAVATGLVAWGWAHPLAVLAGYTTLPFAVVLHGLRSAQEESTSWS